jgi:Spy/CpxP family protein refolding chaperone
MMHAQFPAPPPLPSDAPAPSLPQGDVAKEVEDMSKRYGFSEEQAKKISTILKDQRQKAADIVKDNSLSREESLKRLLATRDEEGKLVSEVLTPEQRKKYEADHPAGPPNQPADGNAKPLSPGSK